MVKIDKGIENRVSQGDILKDIEITDSIQETDGYLEIIKFVFPYVIVMTQDCDLQQDCANRLKIKDAAPLENIKTDKKLLSVIVVPLYNAKHVFEGTHLSHLGMTMEPIEEKKTPGKTLMQNNNPRYHYLDFELEAKLPPLIADFKHYFTISSNHLEEQLSKKLYRVSPLYRELLSQRFANYLSRIGLPEPD